MPALRASTNMNKTPFDLTGKVAVVTGTSRDLPAPGHRGAGGLPARGADSAAGLRWGGRPGDPRRVGDHPGGGRGRGDRGNRRWPVPHPAPSGGGRDVHGPRRGAGPLVARHEQDPAPRRGTPLTGFTVFYSKFALFKLPSVVTEA